MHMGLHGIRMNKHVIHTDITVVHINKFLIHMSIPVIHMDIRVIHLKTNCYKKSPPMFSGDFYLMKDFNFYLVRYFRCMVYKTTNSSGNPSPIIILTTPVNCVVPSNAKDAISGTISPATYIQ
jgi:hypothetical protein